LRTVLRIALNEALRRDVVKKNVAELVRPPSVPKPEIKPFSPDEARRLLIAVQGHRLEALFTVALAIGVHHGEALGLQWEDVDARRTTLRVRHALQQVDGKFLLVEPKSEESRRVVPLPPPGLRMEAMEQGMAVWDLGTLLWVPSLASAVIFGSRPILIRLITLAANCAGARSAVNPHAACDVADVGDRATENPKRARTGKPRIRAKDDPTSHRASVRP
jgi:integrase